MINHLPVIPRSDWLKKEKAASYPAGRPSLKGAQWHCAEPASACHRRGWAVNDCYATKAAMARIVTTQYRYKRPPKKRKPATIKVPEVVTVRDRKRVANRQVPDDPEATPKPANDDRKTRIVTTRPKRGRFGQTPDLTPEEHRERGDAAEALFRELVRRATS